MKQLLFLVGWACLSIPQMLLAQETHPLAIVGSATNDLCQALKTGDISFARFDSIDEALQSKADFQALLVLADRYPEQTTLISPEELKFARSRARKVYIEYPGSLPGLEFSAPQGVRWERGVIASDAPPFELPKLRILSLQDCQFLPISSSTKPIDAPWLGIGRVAGFNTAVYGLPSKLDPILFEADEGLLVATTKLSNFATARFAPGRDWEKVWEGLLQYLAPTTSRYRIATKSVVRPQYSIDAPIPVDAQQRAIRRGAAWYKESHLLISSEREAEIHRLLREGKDSVEVPPPNAPRGDGTRGIMEGYASQILPDGSQLQRIPIRADCQAEAAAALAMHASLSGDADSKQIATNLLNYLYFTSELHQGVRGDPNHPSYGLIAWGAIAPAWYIGNYGDDNARTLLASILAASLLEDSRWDESILTALYANLRTTGKLGFRGDRVDIGPLEAAGWKAFGDASTLNVSPFFESYLWACYLWAFERTGDQRFLDKALLGIRRTMQNYPKEWRWGDNLDRCRMILALSWLVRVQDTAEHRNWLHAVARDLLRNQHSCGAIPEELSNTTGGHYVAPQSNEAYGTSETPLIQNNGDPVSDQLYVSSFALFGLREAVAATGDIELKQAEDRLAEYIVRIQVHSDAIPYLSGTWFRAFDFERWDYWSSSGDLGWGAWCAETGWGPAWSCIALGLRVKETSFWDATRSSQIGAKVPMVQTKIAVE